MKTLNKSVLIPYTPRQMFDVVSDVASYKAFLPWCADSRVLSQTPDGVVAQISIALGFVKQSFTTQNTYQFDTAGTCTLTITLKDGPFNSLDGQWIFSPIDEGRACKASVALRYEIKNPVLAMTLGAAFDKIVASMMDAFVVRAKKIYA